MLVALPQEIAYWICQCLDEPSLCKLYLGFTGHPLQPLIADCLKTRKLSVSTTPLVDNDPSEVDLALLSQLPPCNIDALISLPKWPKLEEFLRQYPQLSVLLTLLGDSHFLVPYFKTSQIDSLRIFNCEYIVDHLPRTVSKLCIVQGQIDLGDFRQFDRLKELVIQHVICPENEIFRFPPSLQKLRLPNGYRYDPVTLTGVVNARVDFYGKLPWSQLVRVDGIRHLHDGFDISHLEEVSVSEIGSSFAKLDMPKLKELSIVQNPDQLLDVCQYLSETQMAQLSILNAENFVINSYHSFRNLHRLQISMTSPLTTHTPFPSSLKTLIVKSYAAIEGIPPQVTEFKVEGHEVSLNSNNLRDLTMTGVANATVVAPNLSRIVVKQCVPTGVEFTNFPNLLTAFIHAHSLELQSLRFGDHLNKIVICCDELRHLWLKLKAYVLVRAARLHNVQFDAPKLVIEALDFDFLSLANCQSLCISECSVLPPTLQKVHVLFCLIDPSFLLQCPQIKNVFLDRCDFSKLCRHHRLYVPLTVEKFKVRGNVSNLWMKWADETKLDSLEVLHPDNCPVPHLTWTMLGLSLPPPHAWVGLTPAPVY